MFEMFVFLAFAGLYFYSKQAWNDNMDIARNLIRPLVQEENFDKQGKVRERGYFFRRIAIAQVRTRDMAERMTVQNFVHIVVFIFLSVILPFTSLILWILFGVVLFRCFLVWVAGNHKRKVEGVYLRLSPREQAEVEQLRHVEAVRLRMKNR